MCLREGVEVGQGEMAAVGMYRCRESKALQQCVVDGGDSSVLLNREGRNCWCCREGSWSWGRQNFQVFCQKLFLHMLLCLQLQQPVFFYFLW